MLAFLYVPLFIVVLYSFNADRAQSWPITNWTTSWYSAAFSNPELRNALILSLEVGIGATALSLVLGSLAALAVHRFRFFGRETLSFALVLPIALPGIVTGIALSTSINSLGIPFSPMTIVDRPHDLLRRGGLQQCRCPAAQDVARTCEEASRDLAPMRSRRSGTSPCR